MHTAEKYRTSRDAALIWEGHKVGRQIGYCHLEKLHRLELLPADSFTVVCFPVKIRGASAGWTRAVAVLNDWGEWQWWKDIGGCPANCRRPQRENQGEWVIEDPTPGQLPPTAT